MGRDLIPPLAQVHFNYSWGVDRVTLIGVNHNAEKARVGVDHLGLEAHLQVPEDRSIIEEGQVGHVLTLLKLGRIDLPQLLALEDFFLKLHGYVKTRVCFDDV